MAKRRKTLPAHEQVRLALLAQSGDQEAMQILIKYSIGLFYFEAFRLQAKDTRARKLEADDLVSAAVPYFIHGMMKFNPKHESGAEFSTYIVYWIKSGMQRSLEDWNSGLNVPSHTLLALRRMRDGDDPNGKRKHKISASLLKWLENTSFAVVSLDAPLPNSASNDGFSRYELLANELPSPLERAIEREECRLLHKAIRELDGDERLVIKQKFFKQKTLDEIGKLLATRRSGKTLSRERARQIEMRALRKLAVILLKYEEG